MTVLLSYDPVLSRVRVNADGLLAAETALVQRSTDGGITWTTVRGASNATVFGGALTPAVDDYEFVSDVVNTYRVSTPDESITYRSTGTASHGADGANVTPGLPAGAVAGDLLLVWCAIRNSGTGTPNTPTGYTIMANMSNARLFGKIHSGTESAPLITFTGAGADTSTSAQMAAWIGAQLIVSESAGQLNGVAQDISCPGVDVSVDGSLVLHLGWKQSDWGGTTPPSGSFETGDADTGIGIIDGQGIVWADRVSGISTIDATSFAITGGVEAISRGGTVVIPPIVTTQSAGITPSLAGQIWLKIPARPFLNRPVTVLGYSDIERPDRGGVFDVVGRSFPVAVTDVRGSRRYTLTLSTTTAADAADLDLILASGDLLFLHAPAGCPVPGGYWTAGQVSISRRTQRGLRRYFDVPLTEIAMPSSEIAGSAGTCATVLATYATCADVLAAHATCASLLELVGDPEEVIVP